MKCHAIPDADVDVSDLESQSRKTSSSLVQLIKLSAEISDSLSSYINNKFQMPLNTQSDKSQSRPRNKNPQQRVREKFRVTYPVTLFGHRPVDYLFERQDVASCDYSAAFPCFAIGCK